MIGGGLLSAGMGARAARKLVGRKSVLLRWAFKSRGLQD
jgi:hypothetical protein